MARLTKASIFSPWDWIWIESHLIQLLDSSCVWATNGFLNCGERIIRWMVVRSISQWFCWIPILLNSVVFTVPTILLKDLSSVKRLVIHWDRFAGWIKSTQNSFQGFCGYSAPQNKLDRPFWSTTNAFNALSNSGFRGNPNGLTPKTQPQSSNNCLIDDSNPR